MDFSKDIALWHKYKWKMVPLILIAYAIGAYQLYDRQSHQFEVHKLHRNFYVTNDNIYDQKSLAPNYESDVLVHNVEVQRILAYVEHPFLYDSLVARGWNLDSVYFPITQHGKAGEIAFNSSLRIINDDGKPFIQLELRVPNSKQIVFDLMDDVTDLLVDRYNQDLWQEVYQQQLKLEKAFGPEVEEVTQLKLAKELYLHRNPIVLANKHEQWSSFGKNKLYSLSLKWLFGPIFVFWIMIALYEQIRRRD